MRAAGDASVSGVGAVVERLREKVCPDCHHVERLSPARGRRLRASVLGRLPSAERRLLGRHDRCEGCGGTLAMPSRDTRRSVTVDDQDLGVVTVTFQLALTRCPECGHDQAPRRVARGAAAALDAALAPAVQRG